MAVATQMTADSSSSVRTSWARIFTFGGVVVGQRRGDLGQPQGGPLAVVEQLGVTPHRQAGELLVGDPPAAAARAWCTSRQDGQPLSWETRTLTNSVRLRDSPTSRAAFVTAVATVTIAW